MCYKHIQKSHIKIMTTQETEADKDYGEVVLEQ